MAYGVSDAVQKANAIIAEVIFYVTTSLFCLLDMLSSYLRKIVSKVCPPFVIMKDMMDPLISEEKSVLECDLKDEHPLLEIAVVGFLLRSSLGTLDDIENEKLLAVCG